jgi:predicted DsbA family dithiol-disulfide isomerase
VLELYSDFACPFCYLAEAGAARLESAGYDVVYRAYELRPAPVPLESPAADPVKRHGWDVMIAPAAAELGLQMTMPNLGVRTRKAHEAARFSRLQGLERAMRDAIFAAYFGDGRDIGRIDVLVAIGSSVGLDATDLKIALDIDQLTDEIAAEGAEAMRMGLGGVPAYVATDEDNPDERPSAVVGLQDYDRLLRWVERYK